MKMDLYLHERAGFNKEMRKSWGKKFKNILLLFFKYGNPHK